MWLGVTCKVLSVFRHCIVRVAWAQTFVCNRDGNSYSDHSRGCTSSDCRLLTERQYLILPIVQSAMGFRMGLCCICGYSCDRPHETI